MEDRKSSRSPRVRARLDNRVEPGLLTEKNFRDFVFANVRSVAP